MFATIPPPAQRLLVFSPVKENASEALDALGPRTDALEIEVLWPPADEAAGDALRRAFGNRPIAMQTGSTLGDRIAMAFSERFFFHRTEMIIACGADDPRLTRGAIDHAFSLLQSCEWVIGPSSSGGFYLIGSRAASFDASMFRDIAWGTDVVYSGTIERLRKRENTLAVLPVHESGWTS